MFSSMDRLSSELLDELARMYARAMARDYFSQVLADEARSREHGDSAWLTFDKANSLGAARAICYPFFW